MLARPSAPAGIRTQSRGGGRSGGAPPRNTVVFPRLATDVRMATGPAVPGRRKNPDITIGSGNGMVRLSARMHVASMQPPFAALPIPFHRSVSTARYSRSLSPAGASTGPPSAGHELDPAVRVEGVLARHAGLIKAG